MAGTSWKTATAVGVGLLVTLGGLQRPSAAVARFTGPTSSQPLALSADGSVLAVANPDNDNVSFFKMVIGLPVRVGNPVVVRQRTEWRGPHAGRITRLRGEHRRWHPLGTLGGHRPRIRRPM